jgi:hypothetical protein
MIVIIVSTDTVACVERATFSNEMQALAWILQRRRQGEALGISYRFERG